jgi:hypothetical protein
MQAREKNGFEYESGHLVEIVTKLLLELLLLNNLSNGN